MVEVGDTLPELVRGPIDRATLALFAGASHDYVPLHIDSDFAKAAGMDDVFAHGMLSMAYLAQMLTHWAPQERLRRWNVRFTAITPLHATVTCRGEITGIFEEAGERLARVRIGSWTDKEVQTLDGEAVVALA
ncbi:MAG TPA: MaoC/PaaZ C-terminal domain-containing protein [Sphingomonas sp.]|nr:MaoC/PaaZ C-terminal domain-containing protein [Sphingomonas sp.]